MKLAYFPKQIARNGDEVLKSVISSANQFGIETMADEFDADVAVIWSVLWQGRMASNKAIYQHYRSLGKPVIVIDIGALHRGITWKIALNNINIHGYYGHQENLDPDRPKKLDIKLGTTNNVNPSIILAAQHTNSLQVQDVNLTGWLDSKISEIKNVSDRPLILRPHPRCRMDLQRFQRRGVQIQQPNLIIDTYDSFDFDLNYHAVINYNSGPGIQSAIAGTRPIVDSSSLAAPVSISTNDVEKPYSVDREQWLIEICHSEYTLEEIKQGRWIQRLHLI